MKLKSILFIYSIMVILSSCEDTCNNNYGETFEDVTFNKIEKNDKTSIHFTLKTLQDLPPNYFESYKVVPTDSSFIQIDSTFINHEKIEIYIDNSLMPRLNQNKPMLLNFEFNDRRQYIDCVHPGSNDSYTLEISGTLKNNDNHMVLLDFDWHPHTDLGGM